MGENQTEISERLARLEAFRESETKERADRQGKLDDELHGIIDAIDGLREWIRLQIWGNGKKEGCLDYRISTNDERIKKLEDVVHTWSYRKGAALRIIIAIGQAVAIIWAIKYLGPK